MTLSLLGRAPGQSQTFDVGQGDSNAQDKQQAKKSSSDSAKKPEFSWGSGIDVARQARAAEDALRRNDYPAAIEYARQAVKSAPQNAELWFLLGYAERLGDHYQQSVDAYNQGLKREPGSVRGMSGLAQTYAKMGRTDDAERLLHKVIDANPKDAGSLQLAGELILATDPQAALELLQRAEALAPTAHTDLLMAHAYERLGKADESQRYLNRAKNRAPHDLEVLRAVAGEMRDEGKYEQAIATLQEIPDKTLDVMAELAYTYGLAGNLQEAANVYSRIAKEAKGNIGLNLSAAQAWVNLGQNDAATPFLEAARRVDKDNYRLHAILGNIASSNEQLAEATAEYKIAIANLPPQPQEGPLYPIELRLNLYELYVRQDDNSNAKQTLDAAAAMFPQLQVPENSRPEMLRLRAAVEAASGDLDAANRDLKEALRLAPSNVNSLTNYATLMWKLGQKDAARDGFKKVLELDPKNREALSSLGYLARDAGDSKLAESYFSQAVAARPKDFAPYLALGDLYTSERNFPAAQANYEKAFDRMPSNALIVAGGANAAMEAHNNDLAQSWLERGKGKMNDNPQLERERERYLTFKGKYEEAAKLGYQVIAKLPNDREGAVYLAYDLYYLNRFDEDMALIAKYQPILPNDRDLPLISGQIHQHKGELSDAIKDFTLAIERDPKMALGYVNRGYALNDSHMAAKAIPDFKTALQIDPNYGEAHLGLAFADLQLHHPKPALVQLEAAQKVMGKSHALHLAKAEGYRQEQDFRHAETEYRAALAEDPNDVVTQLAVADVLYRMRRYPESIAALNAALKLDPANASIFALMAQVHAKQGNRDQTMHDIESAERLGGDRVEILTATGDALLTLGDRNAAMQRFSRALDVPGGDRIGVRLVIAEIFLRKQQDDEARRQIALGFAEARMFPDSPVTPEDITEAANLFLAMHDFDLAETYFDKAKLAGANPRSVGIGLTNTYLAEGDTGKAALTLASLGSASDFSDDYDYLMASANLARQRQDPLHALSAFAQASTSAGEQDQGLAEIAEYSAADEQGRPLNDKVSILPEAIFAPVLEDINVYTLDAKILGVTNPSLLPPPRHSFQSMGVSHFRSKLGNLPVITGFVGESMAAGKQLFPSVGVIQNRNTYDTIVNGGMVPVIHLGLNTITLNGGLQFDVRRDTLSPVNLNENLFRQFLYLSTSSFFNWVSVTGSAIHEAGPFTEQDLNSRDLSANVEFTVGRPWGSNSLITGYSVRDLLFKPFDEEYFNTTSYIGLQHKFGPRLTVAALGEYLRSWRVHATEYAIAQALLPGGRFDFRVNPRWNVQGSFLLSRGEGYHYYDNAQSEVLVSYTRSLRGSVRDDAGLTPVAFPMRFSFGVQQQTFYGFPGSSTSTILPVIHFTLF